MFRLKWKRFAMVVATLDGRHTLVLLLTKGALDAILARVAQEVQHGPPRAPPARA
jgi:hypothetical protein